MPAYPHSSSHAQRSSKTRLRTGLTRGLARVVGGRSGRRLTPEQLARARILIIRPDHLGDVLFLGPAMHWLRKRLPEAHLTLAIGPWGSSALPALTDAYDDLIELPFPAFERGRRAKAAERWRLLFRWGQQLRGQHYDAALIARPDHWWGAMLARFADIPMRLGFETSETTHWLTNALPTRSEHAVASNLRLAAGLTGDVLHPAPSTFPLRFRLSSRELDDADRLLFNLFGVDNVQPLAIIHPGSGAAIKLWELEKWREIARRLLDVGARVLVTGGPTETALTQAVADISSGKIIDLGGRTSFTTLAALLRRAAIALGPDSGPLHLAVAVNTPTVHLFGPSDPILFGPWGDSARHIVIQSSWRCAPCSKFDWPDLPAHGCVKDISVDNVWAASAALLTNMI